MKTMISIQAKLCFGARGRHTLTHKRAPSNIIELWSVQLYSQCFMSKSKPGIM